MAFTKGHKLATGRPKGSPNKVSTVAKEIVEAALGKTLPEEMMENYHKLGSPMDKLSVLFQIAPYCYPRLASVDLKAQVTNTELSAKLEKSVQWLMECKAIDNK